MTNRRIVWTKPGRSTVTITSPSASRLREAAEKGWTDDELMNVIMQQDIPPTVEPRHITTDDLPASRTFRDAWDDSNPEPFVGINLKRARDIAHFKNTQNSNNVIRTLTIEENDVGTSPARRAAIPQEKADAQASHDNIAVNLNAAADVATLEQILIDNALDRVVI